MGVNKKHNRRWLTAYKQDKVCRTCGWNEHPQILVFHHFADKEREISEMLRNDTSLANIKAEIKKCVLLCPNCHSWYHYQNPTSVVKPKIDIQQRRWQHILN